MYVSERDLHRLVRHYCNQVLLATASEASQTTTTTTTAPAISLDGSVPSSESDLTNFKNDQTYGHQENVVTRILEDVMGPEIEKTFCFVFHDTKNPSRITRELRALFQRAATAIDNYAFDVSDHEKTCVKLTELFRHATLDQNTTIAITCRPSPPPLSTVLFSPSTALPLEYVGGIPGRQLHILLHTIFLQNATLLNDNLSNTLQATPLLSEAQTVINNAVLRFLEKTNSA